MVILLLFGFWLLIFGPDYGAPSSAGYWCFGYLIFIFVLVGFMHWRTPARVRRFYKKLDFANISTKVNWDDTKLVTEDKYIKSTMPWKDFSRGYENRHGFMLYYRKLVPKFIPKQILRKARIADIRHHLQEQVGPQGVTRG